MSRLKKVRSSTQTPTVGRLGSLGKDEQAEQIHSGIKPSIGIVGRMSRLKVIDPSTQPPSAV